MIPTPSHLKTAATVLFVLAVVPFALSAVPQLAGATHSYTVLSDSMSPTIRAGDVVFVDDRPVSDIAEGDVVTFASADLAAGGGSSLVTHRVVGVVEREGELAFRTKGDANEEADGELVPARNVVGVVEFSLPYVGWMLSFGGSRAGTFLLLVVPFGLLALSELRALAAGVGLAGGDGDETPSEGEMP